jgi:hypothetical protein
MAYISTEEVSKIRDLIKQNSQLKTGGNSQYLKNIIQELKLQLCKPLLISYLDIKTVKM